MRESFSRAKRYLKVVWTSFCIIITVAAVKWQLDNYIKSDDLTTVSYKSFNREEIDAYPSIGFCFRNSLIEEKLNAYQITDPYGLNWTYISLKDLYSDFLAGYYWDQDMLLIDYDNVTKKIGDYLIRFQILVDEKWITIYDATDQSYYNSEMEAMENPGERKQRHIIPQFKEWSMWTTKCFSIEIPFLKNKKILRTSVKFKLGVLYNEIRPDGGFDLFGNFEFVLHYPKQLIKSLLQAKIHRPVQTNKKYGNYFIHLDVSAGEIFQRRNKYHEPCTEGIPDYDEQLRHWVLKKIGCKPPFWNSTSELPLCLSKEELQRTREKMYQIGAGNHRLVNFTEELPCRVLEKYQVSYDSIDSIENEDELGNSPPSVEFVIKFYESS